MSSNDVSNEFTVTVIKGPGAKAFKDSRRRDPLRLTFSIKSPFDPDGEPMTITCVAGTVKHQRSGGWRCDLEGERSVGDIDSIRLTGVFDPHSKVEQKMTLVLPDGEASVTMDPDLEGSDQVADPQHHL